MRRLGRALLYLWSAPLGVIGMVLPILFLFAGWIADTRWREGCYEVTVKGPFAEWMRRPRVKEVPQGTVISTWGDFTLGWTIILWEPPSEQLLRHARHHVWQGLVLSVFYVLVYLPLLAIYGYDKHPLEQAARRAAGEELR